VKPRAFVEPRGSVNHSFGGQATDRPKVGHCSLLGRSRVAGASLILQGLRDLAYVEGRTFVIEYRSAAWNVDLLADLAVELDIPLGVQKTGCGTLTAMQMDTAEEVARRSARAA
jgi:rhodanese-related sulfurtransferase